LESALEAIVPTRLDVFSLAAICVPLWLGERPNARNATARMVRIPRQCPELESILASHDPEATGVVELGTKSEGSIH
jgi:hypothetical protein